MGVKLLSQVLLDIIRVHALTHGFRQLGKFTAGRLDLLQAFQEAWEVAQVKATPRRVHGAAKATAHLDQMSLGT
jgi:hypothetical protein